MSATIGGAVRQQDAAEASRTRHHRDQFLDHRYLSAKPFSGRPIGTAPPDNGTKFRVVEFLPLDAATEAKMPPEMLQKGITNAPARGIPVKHPLMHRTRSLDYAIILSGEIDMMLDDGDVHLKPGDVIVQQATNHAWVNRGKEPCRILFVLMDSKEP